MKAVWYERTGAGDGSSRPMARCRRRSRVPARFAFGWRHPGVNPADVGRRGGSYRAMEYPRVIPNSDGAGIIDQIGDGVTRLESASGSGCSTASATAAPSAPPPNTSRSPNIL